MQTGYFSTCTVCLRISISKCFKQKWHSLKIDLISHFECYSTKNNAFLNPSSVVQKKRKRVTWFQIYCHNLKQGRVKQPPPIFIVLLLSSLFLPILNARIHPGRLTNGRQGRLDKMYPCAYSVILD